ncbi:response regulator transcription factor [Hymenobacter sp. UYCo722]|uniref:LytR/AlgR family response regulator transcription factor n=1 Tax=Hymenobacter sp. UYCo722 TaxID=3156335 RepID=UPI003397E45A
MSQPSAPLRVLIVDDEPLAHDVLRAHIARVAHLELAGHCYTALEALSFLHQQPVDVLLLDINMPEMTGLELLRALPRLPHTILTTAYSEFALESYEYGVVDYLLKPVSLPRFLKAVAKLPTAAPVAAAAPAMPAAATIAPAPAALLLRDGTTTHRVLPADIRWLEAYGNYVKVQTATGRLVITDTFRHLLSQLPAPDFMQVHKSYAVPLRLVERLEGNVLTVAGQALPLGAAFRQEFLRRWTVPTG